MDVVVLLVLNAMIAAARRPKADAAEGGGGRAPTLADSFPPQWAYVTSTARKNAVCCSRQAGKTSGAELASEVVLARPDTRTIYATLIRRNAKKLFWWPLLEGLKKRGWATVRDDANESDMMLWMPNGAFLQALSCEKLADLERIRGDQADLFIIDECQAPRDDVLGALITKVVPMMLAKRRGRLDLLGTVPEAEPCVFSNRLDGIDEKGRALVGWRTHGWTCFDNPFMRREDIEAEAAESGLYPGHPVYEREILGRRVKDPSKLAYEYEAGRNDYDPATVDFSGAERSGLEQPWRHSMGLDLGFSDHDAIVAKSWRKDDGKRRLYVRWRWQLNHLDVDVLAGVLEAAAEVYPGYIVGDHGGHGAVKVLETLKTRLRCRMFAKPADVMLSVGLVNDDLRTSRILLPTADVETTLVVAAHDRLVAAGKKKNGQPRDAEIDTAVRQAIIDGAGAPLAKELGMVTKQPDPADPSKMRINKKGFHSDLSEAFRYGHHAARHWTSKAPPKEETIDERRERQWRERKKKEARPWG